MLPSIESRIAAELSVKPQQVTAAVALLDEGATVPFIARYRKEATGGLDDTQLRTLEERLAYLRELEERRAAILASIEEQKKLTPELRASIEAADTKQRLEDLYLPYKPKRRTKAQIAREAGLDALAAALLADHSLTPETEAAKYLKPAFTTEEGDDNPGVPDVKAALEGARTILMEQFAEDAELLAQSARRICRTTASLVSDRRRRQGRGRRRSSATTSLTAKRSRPFLRIARWRCSAAARKSCCKVSLKLPEELQPPPAAGQAPFNSCEQKIAARFNIADRKRPADAWLLQTVRWTWQVKLAWQLEAELLTALRERSEEEAIRVFARNLHDLLLAAPAGPRATMGLDPGLRTGVKVAIVDRTGKVLETATVYPHVPRNDWDRTIAHLALLAEKHNVDLDQHRQRHGFARDGQARRRADQAASGAEADEDRRVRGGRFGVLGVGAGGEGISGARCEPARRGVDRAAAAGSAGGAGEDRSEVDRRRPVSARREPDQARARASTPSSRIA